MRILVTFFIILSLFCGIAITTASASDSTETVKQLFDDGSEGLVDVTVEEYWNDNHISGYVVLKKYEEMNDQTGELNAYTRFYVYYDCISMYIGQCSTEMAGLIDFTIEAECRIRQKDTIKRHLQRSIDYYFEEAFSGYNSGIHPLPEMTIVKWLGFQPPVKVFRKIQVDYTTDEPYIKLVGTGYPSMIHFGGEHSLYRVTYDYWISFAYVDKQTNTIKYTMPVNTGVSRSADFVDNDYSGSYATFRNVNGSVFDTLLTAGGFL